MFAYLLTLLIAVAGDSSPPQPEPAKRLTRSHWSKLFLQFSPDGTHIAYCRHYANRRAANQVLVGMHLVRSDGSDDRRILTEFDRDVQIQEHPHWSPDGKQLALTGGGNDTGNSAKDVFVCDVDIEYRATNLRKLIAGPSVNVGEEPAWSPDGKQLAATNTNKSLLVVDVQARSKAQLLQLSGLYCHQPAWSPDGEWIAFASDHADNNIELYKVRCDGSELTRLTYEAGIDARPQWSRDSQWLLFTSNRTGNSDVFLMRADGSGARNVTNHPAPDDFPAWSPDGRTIAFVSMRDGGFDIYSQTVPADITIADRSELAVASDLVSGGLVAHYDFESAAGETVRDRTGRHRMTLVGAQVVRRAGRSFLAFDGKGAHATCGNSSTLHLSGPMTLALWMRPSELAGNRYVLSKHGYNIYLGNGVPQFETRTAANDAWDTLAAGTPLPAGQWSFVAAVLDPNRRRIELYIDGKLSASRPRTDQGAGATDAYPLEFGHYNVTKSQWFRGEIDEIHLFASALSEQEVRKLYEQTRPFIATPQE